MQKNGSYDQTPGHTFTLAKYLFIFATEIHVLCGIAYSNVGLRKYIDFLLIEEIKYSVHKDIA